MLVQLCFFALCAQPALSLPNKREDQTKCYGDLGCFSAGHGLPVPQSPTQIGTVFHLHRQGNSHTFDLRSTHTSDVQSWQRHLDTSKKTMLVIHGFLDKGTDAKFVKLTNELLKKGDFNVIVVDWAKGANTGYQQAVANTYLVGAEVTYLLKYLRDHRGLTPADVHIIGHSLGAQIAGHTGHAFPGLGRISGLDPADPNFSGQPVDRRLDATDAIFVDIIHTDASNFRVISGYGTHDPVGDQDFYPNGGELQPGCEEHALSLAISHVQGGNLAGATDAIACSHGRAVELFIESINSQCKFYGHTCATADNFEDGKCLGCPGGGCPVMGFDAGSSSQRGSFYLSTSGSAPFCGHEYFIELKMAERMYHTYGEFMVTLVGTHGQSEPLKFESAMHAYDGGEEETHVVATHNNIGRVTSIKLQFVKARDLHGLLAASFITVHSVKVVSAETNQAITFCAHEHHFQTGHTRSLTSTSGC